MEELKEYGQYYKMRKGFSNVPQDITVFRVEGNNVMFCWGHHTKEYIDSTSGIVMNITTRDRIITNISEDMKATKKREQDKINRTIAKAERDLFMFRANNQ